MKCNETFRHVLTGGQWPVNLCSIDRPLASGGDFAAETSAAGVLDCNFTGGSFIAALLGDSWREHQVS